MPIGSAQALERSQLRLGSTCQTIEVRIRGFGMGPIACQSSHLKKMRRRVDRGKEGLELVSAPQRVAFSFSELYLRGLPACVGLETGNRLPGSASASAASLRV
jgi:hypothetical protein